MQSLRLPHLISVERVTRTKDAGGNETETWTPVTGFARIPGEVLPDRAGEFFAARQVQATANALIKLWYQPGIEATMRVVHHVRPGFDQYWDVQGVVPFQMNQRELRLMCLWRDTEGWRRGTDLVNAT
jgi:head-tail adaptor